MPKAQSSRARLGGWQVISWALVLVAARHGDAHHRLSGRPACAGIETPAWLGLAYVSLFSMLVGFVFWYRGLAQGGIAAVGPAPALAAVLWPGLGLDRCCANR